MIFNPTETRRGEHTIPDIQKITPCLWFDAQAEEAAKFHTAIFKNSRIVSVTRYGEAGHDVHGRLAGTVMVVALALEGQAFTALNGGPMFTCNEAILFQVGCQTQAEVDFYREKLSEGGNTKAQQCGWLKDNYGVSWQLASSSHRAARAASGRRCGRIPMRHKGYAAHEETGHRNTQTGL